MIPDDRFPGYTAFKTDATISAKSREIYVAQSEKRNTHDTLQDDFKRILQDLQGSDNLPLRI